MALLNSDKSSRKVQEAERVAAGAAEALTAERLHSALITGTVAYLASPWRVP